MQRKINKTEISWNIAPDEPARDLVNRHVSPRCGGIIFCPIAPAGGKETRAKQPLQERGGVGGVNFASSALYSKKASVC